jgi:hypothetical protein
MADNRHVGTAGEHLVAYELSRFGITCVLVPSGSLGVDLLATVDGSKTMAFQVKASEGKNEPHKWIVGKKKPQVSESFFYIFCNIWSKESRRLDPSKLPEFFVVPSEIVAEAGRVKWKSKVPTFSLAKEEIEKYGSWKSIEDYFGLGNKAE